MIVLHNARLVDPASGREGPGAVVVRNGLIADIIWDRAPLRETDHNIDCGGDIVCPGLIDAQVFVGEPGAEHRETISTVTRAAAAGGVTTLLATPDSDPAVDDPAVVDFLKRLARDKGKVRVLACAALTKGLRGEEIAEIGLLQEAGAVAFSTAGSRRALKWLLLTALFLAWVTLGKALFQIVARTGATLVTPGGARQPHLIGQAGQEALLLLAVLGGPALLATALGWLALRATAKGPKKAPPG